VQFLRQCSNRFYSSFFCSLSQNAKLKELLKSVHVCRQSSHKTLYVCFLTHSVYNSNDDDDVYRAGVDSFDSDQHLPMSPSSSRPGRDVADRDIKYVKLSSVSVVIIRRGHAVLGNKSFTDLLTLLTMLLMCL